MEIFQSLEKINQNKSNEKIFRLIKLETIFC